MTGGQKYVRIQKARRENSFVTESINIIEEACKKGHVRLIELKAVSWRREVSRIKEIIANRSINKLGLSIAEIARHIGVTTSAIARALK